MAIFSNRDDFHSKVRISALLIFVTFLPFSMLVNNAAIILLTLNWIFESSFKEKMSRLKGNPLVAVFILYYLLCIAGLIYTENMSAGMFELEKKLSLLLFPLVIGSGNPISKAEIKLVFKGFIISVTLATAICFVYATYRNYQEGHTLSYVFNAIFHDVHLPGRYEYFNYWYFTYSLFADGVDMHPVYLSMYTVFSSCLAVWIWLDRMERVRKLDGVLILFLVYNFIVVVLLSSRIQLFILLLFGSCFILYHYHARKKVWLGAIFLLTIYSVGFAMIYSNPVSRERFFKSMIPGSKYSTDEYQAGGLSLRMDNWKYSLQAISKSPVIGVGTGDAQDELQGIYKVHDLEIAYTQTYNAHNEYLQIALELGLIGFFAFLANLLVPTLWSIKRRNILYIVFILLFSVSCITESMLESNKGVVFYSFFNSVLAFTFFEKNGQDH